MTVHQHGVLLVLLGRGRDLEQYESRAGDCVCLQEDVQQANGEDKHLDEDEGSLAGRPNDLTRSELW